jgi:DNA polymerase III subunit delta
MPAAVNALDWLSKPLPKKFPGVCVAFGDEPFLKREVLARLRHGILGEGDGDYSWDEFDEKETKVALRDVLDELSTVSLFGGGLRVVAVSNADEFVTRFRPQLEDYVAKPRSTGILILEVKTWPANTRLYKAVAADGLQIECKAPSVDRAATWLMAWAVERHSTKLERPAAELMVDIVGPELGLLNQELAKLSTASEGAIDIALVRDLVGGWRAKTAWEMIDAALGGQASEALVQLDRLLAGGEHPLAVLGPLGWTLRQMAAAVGIIEQAETHGRKPQLRTALEQAGVKTFVIAKVEKQLMRLGRQRGAQLLRWLLEADLAMKGASSSPHRARLVLEELICRLAAPSPAPARR